MTGATSESRTVNDFCAGTGSATAAFRQAGWTVNTFEKEPRFNPTHAVDVRAVHPGQVPRAVFSWGSPPCQRFSPSGHFWGWDPETLAPTEPETVEALEVANATLRLARQSPYWAIENPRGLLRKMPLFRDLPRVTVSYCQYGETRQKMTDLFTNLPASNFRPHCKNRDPCHVAAPRGSRTPGSTQGLKSAELRGMVPIELSRTIFWQVASLQGVLA